MKGSFQVILIVVFIALAIFGVLVFSGAIPIGDSSNEPGGLGTVVLWGTVDSGAMSPIFEEFNKTNTTFSVQYVQKSSDTFDQDLLEALSEGKGPDLIFLPEDLAFHYANKIFPFPYQNYSLASFKTTFAGAGEVFLTKRGILALPIGIDPLVMYYNRSMLDANGVIYPPAFWDELEKLVPVLSKKDDSNKIIKSAVALGHFSNVTHAKDILSALFMQAGNSIVAEKNGTFQSVLDASSLKYDLASVLQSYTDFANPNKEVYSWNKSFPESSVAFSKEDLALYFGFGSELKSLVNRNPNQNFSASPIPQIRNSTSKLTGARVMGVAVLFSSKNLNTAFVAANFMVSTDFASKFASAALMAPARRDLLAVKPPDAFSPVFFSSALFGRSWLDPSRKDTDDIFRRMVDGVLSNSMTAGEAIRDASAKLGLLLLK